MTDVSHTNTELCAASLYLQTVCRPVWCHTALWPPARRGLAPDTAAGTCNNTEHHVYIWILSHYKSDWVQEELRPCSWLVGFSVGAHLCAMSLSSLVSTLASDVIPATLHAMSLQGDGKM